jgi:hypothetical protein
VCVVCVVCVCVCIYTDTHQVGGGTHGGEFGASFLHNIILKAHITHATIQIQRQILPIRITRERATFSDKFIEVIGDDRVQDRFREC